MCREITKCQEHFKSKYVLTKCTSIQWDAGVVVCMNASYAYVLSCTHRQIPMSDSM